MLITVLSLLLLLHSGLTVVVLQSGDQTSRPGLTVSFECSMGAGSSMGSFTMYWYRQKHYGAPVEYLIREYEQNEGRFQSSIDTSKNNFALEVRGLLLNDSSTYYCAARQGVDDPAYFGQGTKLTVLDPDLKVTAPTVKVLRPSAKECRNKRNDTEKTIVCLATGFYPDHVSVSWQVSGVEPIAGVATDNAALQGEDKYYTITSRLRVSAKEWYNPSTEFKCTVRFFDGKVTEPYSDSIFGDEAEKRETYLNITQTAKLSYGVFIIKSMVYGVFVSLLVWKLQKSTRKQN